MTNEELQSQTISFLRFPLIVGVVLAHSHFEKIVINGVDLMESVNFPIYTTISYLFSSIFSAILVPLFFFFSGFFFFYKTHSFSLQAYFAKVTKRARTILAPYIFWNLLVIAFFFLSQSFLPELMSGNSKQIADYSISDWCWAFWNTNMINNPLAAHTKADPYPFCFQFWFIRDLMVVMLFSPLIHFLLAKLRQYAIICLGTIWLFGWWFHIPGFSITAVFFFSAGAYFSIHNRNFVRIMQPLFPVSILLYVLIVVAELCFMNQTWSWYGYLHDIGILIGVVVAITLTAHFVEKGKCQVSSFLSSSSFFIYAYHGMVVNFLIKFLFKFVKPHSDGTILALYVLSPAITILIGLFIYKCLKRHLPKATALITGGR